MLETAPRHLTWADRILALVDGDDPATALSKARTFERIFVLIVCGEYWVRASPAWGDFGLDYRLVLVLISALGVTTLSAKWGRLGFAGLALAQMVRIGIDFPTTGNHSYLELLLCVLCASFDVADRQERPLLLRTVRWMTCVVFFYAGVQKLVHSYYFRGEMLAYATGLEAFKPALRLLLPHDHVVRLSHYHFQAGDGPNGSRAFPSC